MLRPRVVLALSVVLGLPSFAASSSAPADATEGTSNIRFVKNLGFASATDIEFGEFTVTRLDENGNPVCVRDANGECLRDGQGNFVYETERRDYAFAGSLNNGIWVVDITDPEAASVAVRIACNAFPADIQVRPDLGLLAVGVDPNITSCGQPGFVLFDVSDPRAPAKVGAFKHARGGHNITFHPTAPLIYLSEGDIITTGPGELPVIDVADASAPKLVTTLALHPLHSAHDVTFNAAGTRAYAASTTHTAIIDTSDPRDPRVVATIQDPAINQHHQADPTPDGRYLVISDELTPYTAVTPQCPGGALHVYDISVETRPLRVGVFAAETTAQVTYCNPHVFRIDGNGTTLVTSWRNAGVRVVDVADPVGLGAREIGYLVTSGLGGNAEPSDSVAAKLYKGYIYSTDLRRGLDVLQWLPAAARIPATEPPFAVVALIDSGINPYAPAFRDRSALAQQHPSTYLPGYPANAAPLNLTLDVPYAEAMEQDQAVWSQVISGKLYWIPGTRIIGAISFGSGGTYCPAFTDIPPGNIVSSGCEEHTILDDHGHGTMTSSRAAGAPNSLGKDARIVMIEGLGARGVRWAADQGWIDIQTNSWLDLIPPPVNGLNPQGTSQAFSYAAGKMLTLAASGNGTAYIMGVAPTPTYLLSTAPAGVVLVGGHDNGRMALWAGAPPHVVADAYAGYTAIGRTSEPMRPDPIACCTSAASPYAAGGAAAIVREARLILGHATTGIVGGVVAEGPPGLVSSGPLADGVFTLPELKSLFLATAEARPGEGMDDGRVHWTGSPRSPEVLPYGLGANPFCQGCTTTPMKWTAVPEGADPYPFVGYGAINERSLSRAIDVLHGRSEPPARTLADLQYALDQQLREQLFG